MATTLKSQTIKNLIQGVSQQPDVLRKPEQLKEQVNCVSSEVKGIIRRPSTYFVDTVTYDTTNPYFIHTIDRDEEERYALVFNTTGISAFALDGTPITVNVEAGTSLNYIQSTNPKSVLKVITVADYTFICNTEVITALSDTVDTFPMASNVALFNIKSGQYGRTYKIFVNGTQVASYATPDGSSGSDSVYIDTNKIRDQLATQLATNLPTATITKGDAWVSISGIPITTVNTEDGFNGQALIGFTNYVQRFDKLPATAPDGYYVAVKSDPKDGGDPYYVRYNESERVWVECPKSGLKNTINPLTMPHALVRQQDGTLLFKKLNWDKRLAGDEDTNPNPSFIDQTITDIFFFKNRLGFTAGENVIMSEVGNYFNYWFKSATDIIDSDAIDVPCSTSRINFLNFGVVHNNELIVFSDKEQFILRADGVLSPKTSSLTPATSFSSSPTVRPIVAGKNIYFPVDRSQSTTIREYYTVQDVSELKNSQDITAHVPDYIPTGVTQMEASTTDNIFCLISNKNKKEIYVYKYLYFNEQKVQSSWSTWVMPKDVVGLNFVGNLLYVYMQDGNNIIISTIDFGSDDNDTYDTFVDLKRKYLIKTADYDRLLDETIIDLTALYGYPINTTGLTFYVIDGKGFVTTHTNIVDNKIHLQGLATIEEVVVGVMFTSYFDLSTIMLKRDDGQGGYITDTEGKLMLRRIEVNFAETNNIIAEVTSRDRVFRYHLTGKTLGTTTLGEYSLKDGVFKVPVNGNSTSVSIRLMSNYPLGFNIIGYKWIGNYIKRTQGV